MQTRIFTIGHSNRSIDGFIAMLKAFDIQTLVDIRSVPQSRYNPQFGLDNLSASLASTQISYVPMKALGGMRQPVANSVNRGLRSDGFRGFADYMHTQEFAGALDNLIEIAKESSTAIMCAESDPAKCHRLLVSDALLAKSVPVVHILSVDSSEKHIMTECVVTDGSLTYPEKLDRQRSLF